MSNDIENKLAELGEKLPSPSPAVGAYVPAIQTGNLIITSGQLPFVGKELAFTGKVGTQVTKEDAQSAARICVLNALAQVKGLVGNLDLVKRVVRVEGFVQSADGFSEQPFVLNGASLLLVDLFGDAGKHARFAVGCNELPLNAAVEVAIWVEV
ncbi:RidA family protein [Lacunimicrobium album]